jgi:Ribbon-helix-helix protein, copG family
MYTYITMEARERTQIYLSMREVDALEREAAATGRSKSDLIREAIDRAYVLPDQSLLLQAIERSAATWRRSKQSGAEYVERLRTGRRLARLDDTRKRRDRRR